MANPSASEIDRINAAVIENLSNDELAKYNDLQALMARLCDEDARRMKEVGADEYRLYPEFLVRRKMLGQTSEEINILLEKCRAAQLLRDFQKAHPPPLEECPICFEESINLSRLDTYIFFGCCGKNICRTCWKRPEWGKMVVCPYCREEPLRGEDEQALRQQNERCASRGIAFAQRELGYYYYSSLGEQQEAVKWFLLAAEQGCAAAMHNLGLLCESGYGSQTEESGEESARWMKKAAFAGNPRAQDKFASRLEDGIDIFEQDSEAFRFYTLAACQGVKTSQVRLGRWYYSENRNLELGKYWLEKAAEQTENSQKEDRDKDDSALAQSMLAGGLLSLNCERYDRNVGAMFAPSHSPFPRAMYLAHQSLVKGYTGASEVIRDIDSCVKVCCSNCLVSRESANVKLMMCVRCKAAYYCGKECQKLHWKGGHKGDCVDLSKLDGNAEDANGE